MKKIILVFWIGALPFGLVNAQGSIYQNGEFVQISSSDSIQTQLIATGRMVEIAGWLGNDLYSAAEQVTIDGTITDDAIIAGRQINMRGNIGDLMAGAGETVIISGNINGDLFAAGREVRILQGSQIHGNANIAAASIIVEGGRIDGVLRAAGESIDLNGTVNNEVRLYGRNFNFGPAYQAELSTNITSDRPVYRENLGTVPENLNITVEEPEIWPVILFKIGFYISLLITGLVLLRIFQKTAVDMHRFATERILKNTGVGVLSFVLVPLAIFILLVLVVTIPLSVILMVLYGLALLVSYLLVALVLGVLSILYFRGEPITSTYYWGLVLGMIYIAIFVNIPFIGWVINLLLLFFGLGSLVYYIWIMSRSGGSTKPLKTESVE